MYVCICNSVTDKAIKNAVQQGENTYEKVCSKLGTASCCGRCQEHVREVIAQARCEQTEKPLVFMPCVA